MTQRVRLDLVGTDRPGIVQQISRVIAACGVNVEEIETTAESAPMSGETLFKATASLQVPSGVALAKGPGSFGGDRLTFQELDADEHGLDYHIARLPERARIVFVLRALEGYRHEEIAEKMNMAVGTSKSQYARARGLLQEWIET